MTNTAHPVPLHGEEYVEQQKAAITAQLTASVEEVKVFLEAKTAAGVTETLTKTLEFFTTALTDIHETVVDLGSDFESYKLLRSMEEEDTRLKLAGAAQQLAAARELAGITNKAFGQDLQAVQEATSEIETRVALQENAAEQVQAVIEHQTKMQAIELEAALVEVGLTTSLLEGKQVELTRRADGSDEERRKDRDFISKMLAKHLAEGQAHHKEINNEVLRQFSKALEAQGENNAFFQECIKELSNSDAASSASAAAAYEAIAERIASVEQTAQEHHKAALQAKDELIEQLTSAQAEVSARHEECMAKMQKDLTDLQGFVKDKAASSKESPPKGFLQRYSTAIICAAGAVTAASLVAMFVQAAKK